MIYKPVGENVPDMVYLGSLASFDLAYAWAQDKCVPLVREITFENGEVGSRRVTAEVTPDRRSASFVCAFPGTDRRRTAFPYLVPHQ